MESKKDKCTYCSSAIAEGRNALRLQEGVVGQRDFVDLESQVFCSERCLRSFLEQKERRVYKIRPRIP